MSKTEEALPRKLADHIEHRLRTWRQQHMNRSGDRLALDDFMGEDSIEDLIDYVCDQWSEPTAPQAAQAQPQEPPRSAPLTPDEVADNPELTDMEVDFIDLMKIVRVVERAHGISTPEDQQPGRG